MRTASKQIALATLFVALGGAAVAQMPAPTGGPATTAHGMREHGGRHDPAKMREHMAARQAALKQKLQITAAQEVAWTTWTTAMQPPTRLQRPDRAEIAKLPTPERIDRMRALRNERLAEMDKRADATKNFYAALTPEQKKVFDSETLHARGGHRGGKHGGHHHG